MARTKANTNNKNDKATAKLGFEQKLWLAADKLPGNMDAAVQAAQAHKIDEVIFRNRREPGHDL
jgi:hypothetical protein